MNQLPRLCILIPLYKSENHIDQLIYRLQNWHNKLINKPFRCELLLIDDGSHDEGLIIAEKLLKNGSLPYTLIQLAQNSGQHNALSVGLNYCECDWIVTLDDDLQHDPEFILTLWNTACENNSDIVYGYYPESKHRFWRNIASIAIRTLTKLFIFDYSKVTSFRLIRTSTTTYFKESVKSSFLIDTHLIPTAIRIHYTEVDHRKRVNDKSRYTFKRLLDMSIKIWLWHSPFKKWNWVYKQLSPNIQVDIQWIGSSIPFESIHMQHHHIQIVRKWRNSRFINQQMDFQEEISCEQQERWFKKIDSNTQFYFVHRYRGEWVGFSHVHIVQDINNEIYSSKLGENGGFICSEKWQGSGVTIAIALGTLDFAFHQLHLDRLRIKVKRTNTLAIELNTALGYTFIQAINSEFDEYELQKNDYIAKASRMQKLLQHL